VTYEKCCVKNKVKYPLCQLSATLIFLKNNHNCHPRRDLFAMLSIHRLFLLLVLARLKQISKDSHAGNGSDRTNKFHKNTLPLASMSRINDSLPLSQC
jgi:hypothetical protein